MKTYKNNKLKYKSKKNNTRKKSYTRKIKKYKNNRKIKNFKGKFTKKGGVGESFVRHFNQIADRTKKEKLRRLIEQQILSKEKFSDKKQDRQNKFNKAFLEDECTICLEDLDDDKGLTQIQKCLNCIDQKDKRMYFTGCDHIFHGRCMDKWLREDPSCPLCRERVIDNIEEVL
tara:strand:- start:213 stop:731 length:519 start_codon:yes stop_codon:yes gene_type:complete